MNFVSTGESQSHTFKPGKYYIRLSGAQGGTGSSDGNYIIEGGRGAIVTLIISFKKTQKLFIYVGSKGEDGDTSIPGKKNAEGGWNGGGDGGRDTNDNDSSGAGGGGTDIRLIDTQDEEGWKSRIAVAAGGSGSAYHTYGTPAGGLYAYKMKRLSDIFGFEKVDAQPPVGSQLFKGDDGKDYSQVPSSGAGGGYYGGTAVPGGDGTKVVGSGISGTSYVTGCLEEEDDEMTKELINRGITILEWTITPGFPVVGNEGDGKVFIFQISNSLSAIRNSYVTILINFFLLL